MDGSLFLSNRAGGPTVVRLGRNYHLQTSALVRSPSSVRFFSGTRPAGSVEDKKGDVLCVNESGSSVANGERNAKCFRRRRPAEQGCESNRYSLGRVRRKERKGRSDVLRPKERRSKPSPWCKSLTGENDKSERYDDYTTITTASCCCSACLNSFQKILRSPRSPWPLPFPSYRVFPTASVGWLSCFPLFVPPPSVSLPFLPAFPRGGFLRGMPHGRTRPKVAFGKQDRIAFHVVDSRVTVP